MDNLIATCDSDYAYVMLKSERSDFANIIFSKNKLDPKDVIQLMYKNKADIGCDLFFTNKKHRDWVPIEFYSGLLWRNQIFKSK